MGNSSATALPSGVTAAFSTNPVTPPANGSASSTFSGAIYFPTTGLGYSGGSGINGYTLLVADTLSFLGNSSVGNDYSCLGTGSLIKDAALVQ